MTAIPETKASENDQEQEAQQEDIYQDFQWGFGGKIVAIQVEDDPDSGKKVVFLEEIQSVFSGEFYILRGNMVVSHLKDKFRN